MLVPYEQRTKNKTITDSSYNTIQYKLLATGPALGLVTLEDLVLTEVQTRSKTISGASEEELCNLLFNYFLPNMVNICFPSKQKKSS